jgi:hypothetical protein
MGQKQENGAQKGGAAAALPFFFCLFSDPQFLQTLFRKVLFDGG